MEARALRTYSSGASLRSSAACSSVSPTGTYPLSGSCAEVWSVTRSGITRRRTNSACVSAALPTRAMDRGMPFSCASRASAMASSMLSVTISQYRVAIRRSILDLSTSTAIITASLNVAARGWAPPMPPSPAVSTSLPLRLPPKCLRAAAAKVSYVPCNIPWVPM